MEELEDFKKRLAKHFGGCVRAISEKKNFDFYAIVQTKWATEDGDIIAYMWPNPEKNFYLQISKVEEKGDEWWLTTPDETWVFRVPENPEWIKDFVKGMSEEGVDA